MQWQPGDLTIHTKKWFLGAGFLGAPPISLRSCTSRAASAEELQAAVAKSGLGLCWAYGGDGTFVEQVGTVNFEAPPLMASRVHLVTLQRGATAPAVLSFTTGDLGEYDAAANGMRLILQFTILDRLPMYRCISVYLKIPKYT